MHRLTTSFILGYHGCDAGIAEKLLSGTTFARSTNKWDWLGHGIYFWEGNPKRGLEFAKELKRHGSRIKKPAVVGALIDLGLCLDLTTSAGIDQVKIAHAEMLSLVKRAGNQMPKNNQDGLRRNLDCAVIEALHKIRSVAGEEEIETVKGVFLEGRPIYETAGFHNKTHAQICVRSLANIKAVFRVPRSDLR